LAQLYLIRHAKAGERRLWTGEDLDRPLSKKGHKQAELVAKRLSKLDPKMLRSSPYVRCTQTLEPLGKLTDLEVEVEQRICEDEPFEPVIELLAELPAGTVLCTHGDIIPATMNALARRGMKLNSPPDWRKAAVWVLRRNKKGSIVEATVWPPPVI